MRRRRPIRVNKQMLTDTLAVGANVALAKFTLAKFTDDNLLKSR